ncbi:hypothetical protein [Methylobacterium sp. A54F]
MSCAFVLADHIGAANVVCELRDTDRYGRTASVCRTGEQDLSACAAAQFDVDDDPARPGDTAGSRRQPS